MQDSGANPFAPPRANLDTALESRPPEMASRWARLGAALLDAFAQLAIFLPLMWYLGYFEGFPEAQPRDDPGETIALGLLGLVSTLGINGWLLYTRGQSVGKWLVGIRIADRDGTRTPFGRIVGLRVVPLWLVTNIPVFGQLVAVIDSVLIFGRARRCGHDYVAGTIVVRVGA